MDLLVYNEENIVRYHRWISMIAECIHSFGKTNSGKKESDIGLKGFVFLDILQRIAFNLHGLANLFMEFRKYPEIKFSINLIFRGILSDVLTGLYLAKFAYDQVSFENEVKMLDRDFAQFAKFMIENEIILTKPISKEESDDFISKYKAEYIKENADLFQDIETWKLKSPAEIRNTSNKSLYLNEDHFSRTLSDDIKYQLLLNSELHHLSLTFVLYRYFSQYHHYSHKGRTTLSIPIEFDMRRYYASIIMINESVHIFCMLAGADKNDLQLLKVVNDEFIIKE